MNKWAQIYRMLFHRKGHGVHSPFVFDLITHVIEQPLHYYHYKEMDLVRLHLQLNVQPIIYQGKPCAVQSYLRKYGVSRKEGELLFRLANHYKPHSILTMGSSMGLLPLYLTGYSSKACCITLEKNDEIALVAQEALKKRENRQIRIYPGLYEQSLPDALQELGEIDFLHISKALTTKELDALYHQCIPHMHDETIVMIGGIRDTSDKQKYWQQRCKDSQITTSVDLYRSGLIFFRPQLHKRMYKSWV